MASFMPAKTKKFYTTWLQSMLKSGFNSIKVQQTCLPRRAQYLFDGNLDDLLQTSIRHWKQWLASVTAAWAMAVDHQSQQDQAMVASQQLMRAWLDGHTTA